jgi:hypothetical protein
MKLEGAASIMIPVSTPNLTAFTGQMPKTRIGVLRLLWPTIQACLDGGHSLRDIHRMLRLDGFEMAYSTLCWAVAILRQNEQRAAAGPKQGGGLTATGKPGKAGDPDPLLNLRRLSERRPGFEYSGTLPDEDLFGSR